KAGSAERIVIEMIVPRIRMPEPNVFWEQIFPAQEPVIFARAGQQIPLFSQEPWDIIEKIVQHSPHREIKVKESPSGVFHYSDELKSGNWQTGKIPFAEFANRLKQRGDKSNPSAVCMQGASIPKELPELSTLTQIPFADTTKPHFDSPRLWIGN